MIKTRIAYLLKQYGIKSISCDSRAIKPSSAFFAIKGQVLDGNQFIQEALIKGAIVFTNNPNQKLKRVFFCSNIRLALAFAAEILYPKSPKNLIAITGTNGKSSVVSYVYQILKLLGAKSATIGTLGVESTVKINSSFLKTLPPFLTTPDPITFRKISNKLNHIGIDYLAFEASSHGIYQNRLGSIKVETIGFTSFSQDHLDYHKNIEDYLRTKLQLFINNLKENGEVVINSNILESESFSCIIKDFLQKKGVRYFLVGKDGDIKINNVKTSFRGSKVYFQYRGRNYQFITNIVGSFQATNLLIAAKIVTNLGMNFDRIIKVIKHVHSVTGRLQRISDIEDDAQVFIDYAHTPEALEKSLSELRKIKVKNGKLYLVFGCGGERDQSKRLLMGRAACKLSDYIIVTDDNPRNEDPRKIRSDILKGLNFAEEICNRKLAIKTAIGKLKKNDILLIAGKGHEEYQLIGNKTFVFSDIKIAKELLILNRVVLKGK